MATALCVLLVTLLAEPRPAAATDPTRDLQWHLSFLAADQVHRVSLGDGVKVAVIDTGVDASHLDLTGNVLPGLDPSGETSDGWLDRVGHGTAMASLIAGHGHGPAGADGALGLAPRARVLPVREGDNAVPRGIRFAIAQSARVVNMSLGAQGEPLEAEIEAVAEAAARGVVVVVSAGNAQGGPVDPGFTGIPGVVVVSGVDKSGEFARNVSSQGDVVALSAPAVDIMAARPNAPGGYAAASGTSDAAALVSAAAALVIARYPELNAASVINRLIRTADDKGPPGRDPQYGFGVVNPLKALTADVPPVEENPLINPPQSPAPSRSTLTAAPDGSRTRWPLLLALAVLLVGVGVPLAVLPVAARRARRRLPPPR